MTLLQKMTLTIAWGTDHRKREGRRDLEQCRDGRPRRNRGTTEGRGAADQAHDKEESCFFAS